MCELYLLPIRFLPLPYAVASLVRACLSRLPFGATGMRGHPCGSESQRFGPVQKLSSLANGGHEWCICVSYSEWNDGMWLYSRSLCFYHRLDVPRHFPSLFSLPSNFLRLWALPGPGGMGGVARAVCCRYKSCSPSGYTRGPSGCNVM